MKENNGRVYYIGIFFLDCALKREYFIVNIEDEILLFIKYILNYWR